MRHHAIIALSTASICLCSTAALAASWVNLGRDAAGTIWYVDRDTVTRTDGFALVWVREDGRHNRQVRWSELKSRKKIDCARGKIMDLGTIMYDAKGRILKRVPGPDKPGDAAMDPIVPGSMGEAMAQAVC